MVLASSGDYVVDIASTSGEVDEVLALRYKVFNEELGEGIAENAAIGRDRDEFDDHCDHLILRYKDKIVGTYRLLPFSKRPGRFYTETEFDLSDLYRLGDELAELGRSCIAKEHRMGPGIALMFAGMYNYCRDRNIKYLAGCASVHKDKGKYVSELYSYFKENGHISSEFKAVPLNTEGFKYDASPSKEALSPLMRIYLRIGAEVLGPPCWDPVFGCYDFPMMIKVPKDTSELKFLQRFLK